MFFSICLNSRDFSFYLFKLCYVYCISIICTSCNRCNLTCYIISYITNGYSCRSRFPGRTCISRCCFGADIITSCSFIYCRIRFITKSYTAFNRSFCIIANSCCIGNRACFARRKSAYSNCIISSNGMIVTHYNIIRCISNCIIVPSYVIQFCNITSSACNSIINTCH